MITLQTSSCRSTIYRVRSASGRQLLNKQWITQTRHWPSLSYIKRSRLSYKKPMTEFIYFLSHSFLMMVLGAWFARKHM